MDIETSHCVVGFWSGRGHENERSSSFTISYVYTALCKWLVFDNINIQKIINKT